MSAEASNSGRGRLPRYYSRLAPFAHLFSSSRPVLTYHHIGPRQRGARLKGLYLSPGLFSRQLDELHAAGFATPEFSSVLGPEPDAKPAVYLTIDDGFRDVFEHGLPVLRQHGFRAILFLVSDLLGQTNRWQEQVGDVSEPLMDQSQVRDWLAAGQEIGSHTRTHPWLTRISPDAAREEIGASKKLLEDRFGTRVDHFCYPYGDWNPAVRDLVAQVGYQTGCTTRVGLNPPGTSPFELRRFTARYPSRSLKEIWSRISAAFSSRR